MRCRKMEWTRIVTPPASLSLHFYAQVKKRVSSLLRSVAFFPACPFRLEAVTKILTDMFQGSKRRILQKD